MSQLMEITSRECKAYLDNGGDLAVIPCASPERLGPHLPLGTRIIVAETMAAILAEKHDGIALPVIPYGTLYEGHDAPGGIDVPAKLMHQYLRDVCMELRRGGFKRMLVVSFADELYYLAHDIFQRDNLAVAVLSPSNMSGTVIDSLDASGKELWRLLACLSHRNDTETLHAVLERNTRLYTPAPPAVSPATQALTRLGNTPRVFGKDEWKCHPVSLGADTPELCRTAKAELDAWLDAYREPLAALSEYQAYLDGHNYVRPI